jgi:hypothetical protein
MKNKTWLKINYVEPSGKMHHFQVPIVVLKPVDRLTVEEQKKIVADCLALNNNYLLRPGYTTH